MPEDPSLAIRPMRLDDVENALLLSVAEGWNQTGKDWRFLAGNLMNICRIAEYGTSIVGSATAMNYENEIAWIGMVLVEKQFRGKGISRLLLTDILRDLEVCRSVKLDATPAGQPVYEKFGFKEEYKIVRMTRPAAGKLPGEKSDLLPQHVEPADLPGIFALDQTVFGANRTTLLKSLVMNNPDNSWLLKSKGNLKGFALGRQGTRYYQIGPVTATGSTHAQILIAKSLAKMQDTPLVVDVPADKEDLILWLNSAGFIPQRHFVRMYLKKNSLPGNPGNQYLICGPEFG